jgi:hypothetical protein
VPLTPDRRHGPLEEDEGINLSPQAVVPAVNGELRYVAGTGFQFFDEGVLKGLSGSGITAPQHEVLDTLVHDLSETCYFEVTRSLGKATALTYWTSPAKTMKVRETLITRSLGRVSQIVENQYDGTGALVQTLTTVFTRGVGNRVVSAQLTETP